MESWSRTEFSSPSLSLPGCGRRCFSGWLRRLAEFVHEKLFGQQLVVASGVCVGTTLSLLQKAAP